MERCWNAFVGSLVALMGLAPLAGAHAKQAPGQHVHSAAALTQAEDHLHVAILKIGLTRTVQHPAVAASFHLLRSSLVVAGHTIVTVLWIAEDEPIPASRRRRTNASDPRQARLVAWLQTAYDTEHVIVSAERLACNRACALYSCSSTKHDGPFRWFDQYYKVMLAWERMLVIEQQRGRRFDWVLKSRTDVLYLEALPPLQLMATNATYTPLGIHNYNPNNQLGTDHIYLCPRPYCAPHFEDTQRYLRCRNHTEGQRDSKYGDAGLPGPAEARNFNLAYALARHNGPLCSPLVNSGKFAPHLPPFVHGCHIIAARWCVHNWPPAHCNKTAGWRESGLRIRRR